MRKKSRFWMISLAVMAGILSSGAGCAAKAEGITLTALSGTQGARSDESFENLFDGNTHTKWCVTGFEAKETASAEWKMSEPMALTGFLLATGNDNSRYEGRNPAEWILGGRNSADEEWEVIDFFTGELADEDYREYRYDFEEPAEEYTYYKLLVTATAGADVMQLSEFRPLYEGCGDDYAVLSSSQSGGASEKGSSAGGTGSGDSGSSSTSGTVREEYTIDGYTYEMEVGDTITFFHSRRPTSTYYAYTWYAEEGADLVELDPDDSTCRVVAKKEGTVVLQGNLDYTVMLGYSSQTYSYEYTMTIHISPASGENRGSKLMTWQTCPNCNGSKKVMIGGQERDCPECGGSGSILR